MSIINLPLPGTSRDPIYPDSDGEPMAETGFPATAMCQLWMTLNARYSSRADVYCAADMFLYYEQGNPLARRTPDVMVCIGVSGNHLRRSYRLWEERVPPTVIFELTSGKTRREDEIEKRLVYARIGVAEYYMFDPEGKYLRPRMRGYHLGPAGYEPVAAEPGGELRFVSPALGLIVEPEGVWLRLTDARTGARLPWPTELSAFADEAEAVAVEAQKRAGRAEQQAKRAQRRAEAAKSQVAAVEEQRDDLRRLADETERRAIEAERRAAALEEEIKRLRGEG
jgi:Uma2 family endonuclease